MNEACSAGAARPERPLPTEEFGEAFLRRVLHLDRVLESIDRILGDEFRLGPMGAGPGRRVATLTADGSFGRCYGEELPGPDVGYRVTVPVEVDFARRSRWTRTASTPRYWCRWSCGCGWSSR